MRLVRYADDFVVMVHGSRDDAEALRAEVSDVLAPMGLRLSEPKTRVCHIDEGFDFLGWRIQRRAWRGREGKWAVYTYPSKKSLGSIMDKVRRLTRRRQHRRLADLLRRLNPVLRAGRAGSEVRIKRISPVASSALNGAKHAVGHPHGPYLPQSRSPRGMATVRPRRSSSIQVLATAGPGRQCRPTKGAPGAGVPSPP